MKEIKWTKITDKGTIKYHAEIGPYTLSCWSSRCKTYNWWYCHVSGGKSSSLSGDSSTPMRKSLKIAKSDGEKLVTQLLFDRGFAVVEELKKAGLLGDVLSEVGVDL